MTDHAIVWLDEATERGAQVHFLRDVLREIQHNPDIAKELATAALTKVPTAWTEGVRKIGDKDGKM